MKGGSFGGGGKVGGFGGGGFKAGGFGGGGFKPSPPIQVPKVSHFVPKPPPPAKFQTAYKPPKVERTTAFIPTAPRSTAPPRPTVMDRQRSAAYRAARSQHSFITWYLWWWWWHLLFPPPLPERKRRRRKARRTRRP